MPTVDELSEQYLASRRVSTSSLQIYRQSFDTFFEWARRDTQSLESFDTHDLGRYERALRAGKLGRLSDATIHSRIELIARFYKWLMANRHLAINDLMQRKPKARPHGPRETLTIEELRSMWQVTRDARDRVAFGLLSFTGLRNEAISTARLNDLFNIEGRTALRLSRGSRQASAPYAVLPQVLVDAIWSYAGERRSGPLLLSLQNHAADRRVLSVIVKRLARDAGITIDVLPSTLMFSMRNIALSRGFSYAGVVHSTGAIDARSLARLVTHANIPQIMNAAERMARLVTNHSDMIEDRLLHAEVLLYESDSPPATAAMLVGAALEAYLRTLCRLRGVVIADERKARIPTYGSALSKAKVIQESATQGLALLAAYRDDAAHGWFELIDEAGVVRMIRETRHFCAAYPLAD